MDHMIHFVDTAVEDNSLEHGNLSTRYEILCCSTTTLRRICLSYSKLTLSYCSPMSHSRLHYRFLATEALPFDNWSHAQCCLANDLEEIWYRTHSVLFVAGRRSSLQRNRKRRTRTQKKKSQTGQTKEIASVVFNFVFGNRWR